uniref:Uncharacterized protein n=1 Tax=uncultured bacterium HB1-8 TaxID=138990 RepID=Q99IZ9_9BACT|nr:unknown [uncultured bacterium HB1-8]
MSNWVDLPDSVNDELIYLLATRYPELENESSVNRTISPTKSKEPKVRYEAQVRYFTKEGSFSAFFQYVEVNNYPNGYTYSWYSARDDAD